MMQRDSFLFYRSFYEAIKDLPRDIRGEVYTAIMEYGLNGITTENLKPVARSIFTLIKPVIDACNKQYSNGLKGGRPRKEETQPKPNENPTETLIRIKDKDREEDKDRENITLSPRTRDENRFAPLNANDVAFADFYKNTFGTEFLWNETTSDGVQRLVDCITDKISENGGVNNTAEMPKHITAFLEAVHRLGDNWINQRLTPQLIAKQFNQLYNQITNGSKQTANYRKGRSDNPTGVSAEYLAKIAADLGGGI